MKSWISSTAAALLSAAFAVSALAQPSGPPPGSSPRPAPGASPRPVPEALPRPVPGPSHRPAPAPSPGRWWDGAHGHARYYPAPGWHARRPPAHSHVVFWAGINYSYFDGVWYAPGGGGYVVVRPPIGIVVHDLPAFRTAVVIGGLTYLYANGVYYRERPEGGYEVVPTPVEPAPAVAPKQFVYPRQGQSADQQAGDEYECHRWAVTQSGFDPTAAATGNATGETLKRNDYQRARSACLEGRGYTVR